MEEKISNHPCHRLSIPSAKLFWCRHCMQSFEDPITRWRHSKNCKTWAVSNPDKRLEQETIALQNYCETKQRLEGNGQNVMPEILETVTGEELMIVQHETVGGETTEPKAEYSCFICKRPFSSIEDMKEHVKYPCSRAQREDLNMLLPVSRRNPFAEPSDGCFPMSSRQQHVMEAPIEPVKPKLPIITRKPVLGEIIEQSADPNTGVRTFEVHSQNDDIPLSDILSKLSEGGYLVAGEEASTVSQVVVVQQVNDKGQITQTEHILPPHIQIQQAIPQQTEEELQIQHDDGEIMNALDQLDEIEGDDESSQEEVTYYITETGELTREPSAPEKLEIKQEPVYYCDDQLSGMNILTQAAEATIGNLIYSEKRKADDEEEKNVKKSRVHCKPDEDFVTKDPPHSPRSPRPDFTPFNGNVTIVGNNNIIGTTTAPQTSGSQPGHGAQQGGTQQTTCNQTWHGRQQEDTQQTTSNQTGQCKLSKYEQDKLEGETVGSCGSQQLQGVQQGTDSNVRESSGQKDFLKEVTDTDVRMKMIERSLSVNLPINNHPAQCTNLDKKIFTNIRDKGTNKEADPKLPDIPKKVKNSKRTNRRNSYEDEHKCRICDKTFRTSQLLNRHSQFPCKIFNTRNMSQKVLRPKRGTGLAKLLDKKTNPKVSTQSVVSKSQTQPKSTVAIHRKPMLLLHGLKVSNLFEDKKKKQKVKKKVEPSYIPTSPSIKTIWLPDQKLIVEELPVKENFFYELDLVASYHITGEPRPVSPVDNYLPMATPTSVNFTTCSKISVFTPLSISTEDDCLRNSTLLDDFSPPVLERMDLVNSPDLSSPNLSEPPVLIPAIDAITKSDKVLDDDDYILDFSSTPTPKSKMNENRRHFMDLFIEASPITAQKPQESQVEEKNDKKSPLNNILKEDLISKLTNSLKKKLTPQKGQHLETSKPVSVKRDLLSSFNQVSNHLNTDPQSVNKPLILPITKLQRGQKSPSRINVIIFKHKTQFREFSLHKKLLKQSFENQGLEDEVCELLDDMLEKVSYDDQNGRVLSRSISENIVDSDLQESLLPTNKNIKQPEVEFFEIKEVLNYIVAKVSTFHAKMLWKNSKKSALRRKEVKKLLQSMLSRIHADDERMRSEQVIRSLVKDLVSEVSDTIQIESNKHDISKEIHDIVDKMLGEVAQENKTMSVISQLLNEMISVVSDSLTKSRDKERESDVYEILKSPVDEVSNNSISDFSAHPFVNKSECGSEKLMLSHSSLSSEINTRGESVVTSKNNGICDIQNELITNEPANEKITTDSSCSAVSHSDNNANKLTPKLDTIKIEVDDGEDMFFVMKDGNLILKEMVSDFDEEVIPIVKNSDRDQNFPSNRDHQNNLKSENNVDRDHSPCGSFEPKKDLCPSPNYSLDEGIVSDMTTNEFTENEIVKNENIYPVAVQYINRIDSIETLTSDKLNYGIEDNFEDKGSPDYLVNKIDFSEEEIILNDSGLDDGDEILTQFSLDVNHSINNLHSSH